MTATGINVSWTQESSDLWPGSLDTTPVYSLTISYSLNCEVISLNKSSYYFTAPEGAPFCEVYNFSVTATHTGAKADCSLPSPILSRMLPHLPDIDQVESSLTYSLTKYPNKGIILLVSFKVGLLNRQCSY